MDHEIVNNLSYVQNYHPEIMTKLLESLFRMKKFDEVIATGTIFLNKSYSNFDIYYYILASHIGKIDFIKAIELIKNDKVLSDPSIKFYYSKEEANYSNIHNLSKELFMMCGNCLLLINYIVEIVEEFPNTNDINKEYLLLRYFDLLNMLYEQGFEENIIERFSLAMTVIFELAE